jgi:hypothetical protein
MQYNFGSGTVVATRTDVANAQPTFFGVLQDIELDLDETLKELKGQYKMAVDVAPADFKITFKAKFAKIQANALNNLMLGDTYTAAAGFNMAVAEPQNIPATGPYTVTTNNAAHFTADRGVFYASNYKQFTPVAASPAVAQYTVNPATGIYTFAAADEGVAVLIYYDFTVTNMNQITGTNNLMGTGPAFSLSMMEQYTNNAGVTGQMYVKLNACRASKITLPMKNNDYTVQEIDGQAFPDPSGTWGYLATTD